MDLDLLLARADDQSPVIEGLPFDAATLAPTKKDATEAKDFPLPEEDPNLLSAQRWGVVAPEGPAGDRLLELIAPLRKLREEEQDAEAMIFRVPAGQDVNAARTWIKNVFLSEDIPIETLPRYMLLLGDLDQVSLELQQAFPGNYFAGRLACASDEGYTAYVKKALQWEESPSAEALARALFFTARDNTAATSIGYRALVTPSIEKCREKIKNGWLKAKDVVEIPYDSAADAKDAFLEQLSRNDPSMLFTMTHGLGAPRKGWASLEEQYAMQGAISMGTGVRLTAEDIAQRPFLPGGIWFFLACYGGGTPKESAYHQWLLKLRDAGGFGGRADSVLSSLPKEGDRPFIAALPKAALANPNGPLAIMAHMDLAWTYSFQDVGAGGQDRPSRFEGIFRSMVNGKRAGIGHYELLNVLFSTSEELAKILNNEIAAELRGKPLPADKARELEKANLWMLRADLAGYILLGDPAARLPISSNKVARKAAGGAVQSAVPKVAAATETQSFATPAKPAEAAPAPEAAKPAAAKARDPYDMEDAVVEVLRDKSQEKAIAERTGVSRAELRKWIETYQEAGRAALAKLT
jgi:hypothetical protein